MSDRRRWAAVLLGAAGAGLVIGAATMPAGPVHATPVPDSEYTAPPERLATDDFVFPEEGTVDGAALIIPDIDLEVALVDSTLGDGLLEVPPAPQAGWYSGSQRPGSATGSTVIAGHVDFPDRELTEFARLHQIPQGAAIHVRDADGEEHTYVAEAMQLHEQDDLPVEVFATTGDPVLHLVTCAGSSVEGEDRWNYEYNLVITARLVETSGE